MRSRLIWIFALLQVFAWARPADESTILYRTGTVQYGYRLSSGVRFADQYPGMDDGAKINAAIADCGKGCTVVDGSALTGLTAAETITLDKSVTLKMPSGEFLLSGSPGIDITAEGASLVGDGSLVSVLKTTSRTADVVQVNGKFWTVRDLGFRSAVSRTGGAGLNIFQANGNAEHLRLDRTYDGIKLASVKASGHFVDIRIGAGLSSTGNWNCGVNVGGIATGTVTSIEFFQLAISEDAPFADAAICVYDGADTIYFYGANIGQVHGVSSQAVHIGRKVEGSYPQWIKFVGGNFEASSDSNNIVIDAGRDIQFYDATVQNGIRGLCVKSCVACGFYGGNLSQFEEEAVKLSARMKIIGAHIGDAGRAADNTYDSIHVDAGVSDFQISDVLFANVVKSGIPQNRPRYNIFIEDGDSDRYVITNNDFGESHLSLYDGGRGTNKILFNLGAASKSHIPGIPGFTNVCDSATRGQLGYVPGAQGEKDTFQVCAKDAGESYAWRRLY
jgi:hypothetical protein